MTTIGANIVNEGYLFKESIYLKALRKRWMVLKGNFLYSYKPSDGKGIYQNPTEIFNLTEFKDIKHNKNKKGAQFELISEKETRVFVATNIFDMNQWIACIKNIITVHITSSGTGICYSFIQNSMKLGKECTADSLQLYSKLIYMGYDQNYCLEAAHKYPNDLKKAIEYVKMRLMNNSLDIKSVISTSNEDEK
eukprot:389331_1